VTADTVFEAASLGKPVFAYAVLRLASLGRFDIDRPLSAYWVFPDLAGDERARKITAAMVLSHTSGLPNQRDSTGLRTVLEPGTGFLYSGEAFLYLQKVVEHVTGMDAETLVSQMVFRPFGMRNSSFVWQPEYNATAATGTDAAGLPVTKYRPDSPNVAGGLHTTSSDYARFLSMAMKQWGLSRKIRARMLKPAVKVWVGPGKDPDYVAWGLGFALQYSAEEGVSMWHWGDNNVFKAFAVAFPRRHIAMVYLSNGVGGLSIRDEVVDATVGGIHPAFHWLEIPQYRGRSGSDEQNPVFGNEP
jgi:CubicO group peptidase (beta-lactamase class C family)